MKKRNAYKKYKLRRWCPRCLRWTDAHHAIDGACRCSLCGTQC